MNLNFILAKIRWPVEVACLGLIELTQTMVLFGVRTRLI
jgi:hypothetical protein